MAQQVHTRTIHTITIDLEDKVFAGIEDGDEVEVQFVHRNGSMLSSPKKLTRQDLRRLTDGRMG